MSLFLKLVVSCLLFISFLLSAHQRSESYSKWTVSEKDGVNTVNVVFTIKLSVLSRLEGGLNKDWENKISQYLITALEVKPKCVRKSQPRILTSLENDFIKVSWTMSCGQGTLTIKNNAFFNKDATHSHIARLILNENVIPEKLFTDQDRTWKLIKPDPSKGENSENASFTDYLSLGVKHISTGYDHLAFLLGLLLLNQQISRLLLAITGFTLGHSLTLGIGVFNYIKPISSFIEAFIGYSIIIVGLEFIIRKARPNSSHLKFIAFVWLIFISFYFFFTKANHILGLFGLFLFTICYLNLIKRDAAYNISLIVTSLFGLVHGFGFGGYLSEIGLPDERLIIALFGFNVGVEIGQLFAVAIFILIGLIFSRLSPVKPTTMTPILASSLVALGTFWFLDRTF